VYSHSPVFLLLSFIFGTILGSFLNVCIYRLPKNISIIHPHSHCTSCKSPIKFYNNIPVISFLLLRGKCKNCDTRICPTYLIVEILAGLICVFLVWRFGLSLDTLFYLIFLLSLVVITFIDIDNMIIPNAITIPGIVIGIIYGSVRTDWSGLWNLSSNFHFDFSTIASFINYVPVFDSIFGAILGGGILLIIAFFYESIRKREGIGMGDVKLLAMIGAFLGWKSIIIVLLISSLLGTIAGLIVIIFKKGDLKYALPFGPFLSLAAALYLIARGLSLKL
jgi:leader peptidase (prepilin peptidase) / N-methyltransferase